MQELDPPPLEASVSRIVGMTLEILSIGNELLSGHTINSNASIIGQALLPNGFSVDRVTLLPDEETFLKKGIEEAMERSSFIIITGGLGPTGDDLTRDVVADIFSTSLIYDEAIANDLIKRFGKNLPTIKDQVMVPKGATIIPNPLGTAPGFILEGKATVFVLPGVPPQMEAMLPAVISHLEKHHTKSHYIESLYLCLLSEQGVDPYLRTLEKENPAVEIGICPGYGNLSIYIHGKDPKKLSPIREKIAEKFQKNVFSTSSKLIEVAFHEWMVKNKKTFASAESCTGGQLAARLTAHADSSDYFLGSIVSYSNHLKETALGVSPKTLETHGAVSKEVVLEMVEGAKKLTGADYAIATSGIAGPDGGTPDKPVGTVWSAIATPEKTFAALVPIKGSGKIRSLIIDYTVTYLLATLYRHLVYQIEPYS